MILLKAMGAFAVALALALTVCGPAAPGFSDGVSVGNGRS
jgi:hypothetical protein